MTAARFRAVAKVGAPTIRGMPLVWVMNCRTVIRRQLSGSPERYFAAGSFSFSLPSCTSSIVPTAVIAFDMEPMAKTVSAPGTVPEGSERTPYPFWRTSRPLSTTASISPGVRWRSMATCITGSAIVARREEADDGGLAAAGSVRAKRKEGTTILNAVLTAMHSPCGSGGSRGGDHPGGHHTPADTLAGMMPALSAGFRATALAL